MVRTILIFGVVAGLVVAVPMFLMLALVADPGAATESQITGYLLMLVALSLIFAGVKRYRDHTLGGVIKFLPALGAGLGISVVAALIYVIGWEITLMATDYRFADDYASAAIEKARSGGASATDLDRLTAQMATFRQQYADPSFRLPVTFIEIFPIGVVISLISAGLLRNSRFLPARAA